MDGLLHRKHTPPNPAGVWFAKSRRLDNRDIGLYFSETFPLSIYGTIDQARIETVGLQS